MPNPFNVFPKLGYKNSQFQLISNLDDLQIDFYLNGELKKSIIGFSDYPILINKFDEAGKYVAKSTNQGQKFEQIFEVKNAYRLGSSEFKKAFIFDNSKYSFFLLKDRLLIYDEKKQILLTENHYSPTEIYQVDEENYLFITEIGDIVDGIVNFGIYNTNSFSIIGELLNDYQTIYTSFSTNKLWVLKKSTSSIHCFELISKNGLIFSELKFIENAFKHCVNPINKIIIIQQEEKILFYDPNNLHISAQILKHSNNAIDQNGNIFIWEGNRLTCTNILDNYTSVIPLSNNPNLVSKEYLHIGTKFKINDPLNDIADKGNQLIEERVPYLSDSYHNAVLSSDDALEISHYQHYFFPSISGLYMVEEIINFEVKSFALRKQSNHWTATPSINKSSIFTLKHCEGNNNTVLIQPTTSFKTIDYYRNHLIISEKNQTYLFIEDKTYNFSNVFTFEFFSFDEKIYLITKEEGLCSLYLSPNFDDPLLDKVRIHNLEFLKEHEIIWHSGNKKIFKKDEFINAFDIRNEFEIYLDEKKAQHSLFKDASSYKFEQGYILSSNKIIINPRSIEIKGAVIGKILAVSKGLNKTVSIREDKVYISIFNPENLKFEEKEIELNLKSYKESYLSPNGRFLVLQDGSNKYLYYDIEKNEVVKFLSGDFLAFSKEGDLIIEIDGRRNTKILDPLTFEDVTPPNYHHFRFLSPNGKLYAQVSSKRRYTNLFTGKIMDNLEVIKFREELNSPNIMSFMNNGGRDAFLDAIKIVDENRIRFLDKNKNELNKKIIFKASEIRATSIIKEEYFTEIGIVGTDIFAEIHFPTSLQFYNYAAFSYDNKFFAYVGKPSSKGLIHLFKIHFDEKNNILKIVDSYLSTLPKRASWVCGFSKNGYFATYDSIPDTYILRVSDEILDEKIKDEELQNKLSFNVENQFYSHKMWKVIPKKNFLCFSPSGIYLALSEQGYNPLTLGGYGHQESNTVHIAFTGTTKIVKSFTDHGDRILSNKYKNITFVAFSEDENRIMSMSSDGVVIIRDINLYSE